MICYLRYWQCLAQRIVLAVCLVACSTRPEIIADPPQHNHAPPEIVPWEEEYARMQPAPEIFKGEGDNQDIGAPFHGELLEEKKETTSGPIQFLADVIAFPFRGVGWILSRVF